jgi:CheY-like chemotaxis protein
MLLGVARLQLLAGLHGAAGTTLEQARQKLEALRRRPETPRALPRRRALLVEDNDNERELLARLLRQAGLEVDTAGDGVDALDYLQRGATPDVVLIDMVLPRCDGPTAIREIRRDPRTAALKVYAVSGHTPGEFDLGNGVDGWFAKPVDPEAMVRRLSVELTGAGYSY